MNSIDHAIERFRETFELHDVGKETFTLCRNSLDNPGFCDGGISIEEDQLESAELHLERVEAFLRKTLTDFAQEVEEKVIGEDENDDLENTDISYEDACDAESRNDLRKEQRQALHTLIGEEEVR